MPLARDLLLLFVCAHECVRSNVIKVYENGLLLRTHTHRRMRHAPWRAIWLQGLMELFVRVFVFVRMRCDRCGGAKSYDESDSGVKINIAVYDWVALVLLMAQSFRNGMDHFTKGLG